MIATIVYTNTAVKQSQKSTAIEYRADKRFTDILTVLK